MLSTNSTSDVGNINRLWSVRSQSKGTISTSVFKTVMAAAWATPGAYVFIHRLWRRLGHRIGNHRQLTFGSILWVAEMHIYDVSQTCLV